MIGTKRYKQCSRAGTASVTNPGLVTVTDFIDPDDLTDPSKAVTPLGALRLMAALINDRLAGMVNCANMQRVFNNATWDPVAQKFNLNCPPTPVRMDFQNQTLYLDIDSKNVTLQQGLLDIADTLNEQYEYADPNILIKPLIQ